MSPFEFWFLIIFSISSLFIWLRMKGVARAICSWLEAIHQQLIRHNELTEKRDNQEGEGGGEGRKKFAYLTGGR